MKFVNAETGKAPRLACADSMIPEGLEAAHGDYDPQRSLPLHRHIDGAGKRWTILNPVDRMDIFPP
jgi:hypothetical protein